MPNTVAVQVTAQGPGADDLAKAEAGGKAIATAAAKGTTQVQASVQQLGNTLTTGLDPLQKFAQGLTRLDAREPTRGMFALRTGLQQLSLEAVGTTGPLAKLGESFLAFGVGGAVGLSLLAGVAGIGAAVKGLTAPLEAVTKDAAAMSAEFGKVQTQAHPSIAAMQEIVGVAEQLEQIQKDAKPNFWEQLFGTGVFGMLGGGPIVDDLITAQKTLANSADATARSLKPVLDQLVAIGQTKTVLSEVATQMRSIGDIGASFTRNVPQAPHAGVLGLDPRFDIPAHTETTATGLTGALREGIAKLPKGLSASERAAAIESLTKGFASEAGKSLEAAGQQITGVPVLEGMFKNAESAVRASGVPKKVADEMVRQLQGELLRAIEAQQAAIGPSPALSEFVIPTVAPLEAGFGTGPLGAPAPTLRRPGFLGGGNVPFTAPGPGNISAVNNLKALDDGAVAAKKFADETNKAADKVAEAGEKFAVTLTRSIGNALLLFAHSPSPGSALAAGSSVLSTFAQQRFTPEDEKANPANIAGTLKNPGLALPATVLSIGAGLLDGFKSLFSSSQQVITIGGYTPAALAQLRELSGSGTLVAINQGGGAVDLATLQYQLNRRSRQDAIPRLPVTHPGPGNS